MKNSERIRELESQLEDARHALNKLGKGLLNIAESELEFIACEIAVLQEHPSIELAGVVYGGLAALTARLSQMAETLGSLGYDACKASGQTSETSAAKPTTIN